MQDGGARPTQRSWTVYLQTEGQDGKILKHKRTKKRIKTLGFSEGKEGRSKRKERRKNRWMKGVRRRGRKIFGWCVRAENVYI